MVAGDSMWDISVIFLFQPFAAYHSIRLSELNHFYFNTFWLRRSLEGETGPRISRKRPKLKHPKQGFLTKKCVFCPVASRLTTKTTIGVEVDTLADQTVFTLFRYRVGESADSALKLKYDENRWNLLAKRNVISGTADLYESIRHQK